jgi:hypothetical protein
MKVSILILVFLHIIYFFPFYFTDSLILGRDLPLLVLPAKFEAVNQWRKGTIPFWSEKLPNGQPLLANPTSSSLYPLLIPLIINPSLKVFTYICLFHHLLFLLGIFFFSNLILKNPYLSLFLSIFLGYNGIIIEFFSFCNPLWGIMYLPWCLLFFYKFLTNNKKINLILTSFLFALSILAGFDLAPLLFSFSLLLLTFYINYKKIKELILCFLLAFLLSSLQIIPTLYYLPHTTRAEKQKFYEDTFGFYSLHPLRVFDIFLPNFHYDLSLKAKENFWADAISDKKGLFPTPYFGLFSILLLFSIRPFYKKWLFFSLTILFLLLSFGRYFPLHFNLQKLPILSNIRFPEKFLIFLLFFFYFYLIFNFKNKVKISLVPAIILIISISSFLLVNFLSSNKILIKYISYTTYKDITVQPNLMERNLIISLFISIFVFSLFFASRKLKSIYILFPFLCFFDLWYVNQNIIGKYSSSRLSSPLVNLLKNQNALRIYYIEENIEHISSIKDINLLRIETLYPNLGVLFGFSYAFVESVDLMDPSIIIKGAKNIHYKLWGISHIILSGWKGPKGEEVYNFNGYEVRWIDKNPTLIWFLNERTKEAIPLSTPKKLDNPSHLMFNIKNKDNGVLWIGYSNLAGWKVFINKKETKMANYDSEGLNVFLKSGINNVEFVYKPPGLFLGIVLSSIGILLCGIILLWKRKNLENIFGQYLV